MTSWAETPEESTEIDTGQPHSARVYDYILGGKDHYLVDENAGDAALQAWPGLARSMRTNRSVMRRMAHWLAAEAGMRQFLDIGTGLPTEPNLHQVVQGVAPDARVVYVDNDPIVLAHARALLTSTPEGATAYVNADMRAPRSVLDASEVQGILDLSQPVAVTIIAMLQFVPDAAAVINALTARLPAGSHVALTLATADLAPGATELAESYTASGMPMYLRTHAEVAAILDGFTVLEPGIVPMDQWHPGPAVEPSKHGDSEVNMYAAVARV